MNNDYGGHAALAPRPGTRVFAAAALDAFRPAAEEGTP
jgi:hypothetical protein